MGRLSIFFSFILSSFLVFLGCGGGEGRKDTHQEPIVSGSCFMCHVNDFADTHYDLTDSAPVEGYVLESAVEWAPEGTGYVLKTGDRACSASCHDYHDGNISINHEWFRSGHADINSEAFASTHIAAPCLRCHSGIGYASYVASSNIAYPGWVPPVTEIYPHHITCNGCHDTLGYPTAENKRLRKAGNVTLTSGRSSTSVQDAILDVGNSASCFTCHQGMESGWSLYKKMKSKGVDPYNANNETMTELDFVNPHYMSAGPMLFSLKGFEFKDKTYSNGIVSHQIILCTGCHMADSADENLGGHTFNISHEGKMNTDACQVCHPGLSDFGTFRLYDRDMDGDGFPENIKEEIEGLKALIIVGLENAGIYYNPHAYPYFFKVASPQIYPNRVTTWKENEIEAAFNLQFVDKEPGAYVHNFRYVVQLLRDSYEALTGELLPGMRPSSSDDRPATIYTP
ncbi:MAG: hypothetical protein AB1390_02095 [Nitrospirota bacterium]